MISRPSYLDTRLCACLAADAGDPIAAGSSLPPGYTLPSEQPEEGKAPGLQTQLLPGSDRGLRSWALVFGKGDEVMSGLADWARREKIRGAHLSAIGALSSVTFAWFDLHRKAYKNIAIDEQVECISLIGDVGLVEGGKPALHVHGCVGFSDGIVKGGHLLSAIVFPTLEVFATEYEAPLHKVKDEQTTLELFQLEQRRA